MKNLRTFWAENGGIFKNSQVQIKITGSCKKKSAEQISEEIMKSNQTCIGRTLRNNSYN